MDDIIFTGYEPGVIGRITELHGTYYHKNWGMGLYFEAHIAVDLAEFMNRFDAAHDNFWVAKAGEKVVGSIIIDGSFPEGARLRFFILDPDYQGLGIGNRLMQEAIDFSKRVGHKRVYLTTFAGLNSARHLYEKFGFKLYEENDGTRLTGNPALTELKFEIFLEPITS